MNTQTADIWEESEELGTLRTLLSPSDSQSSSVRTDSCGTGPLSSSDSKVTYDNTLSENAIESIRRQQDQNKLIHLDPIPDFTDKSEIKPWLQKIFYPQGIEIVIERSDNIKIVFKCKATKRGKSSKRGNYSMHSGSGPGSAGSMTGNRNHLNLLERTDNEENVQDGGNSSPNSSVDGRKKKRAVSPYNTCPFRVRATYSLKRKKWNIVVVNNAHSHELRLDPNSEDYKKFKKHLADTNDLPALKKFDELEYRTRFNLPIELTPIPCDCGLTQEIQSFNIVLPTTNVLVPGQRATSSESNNISKPRKGSKIPKQITRRSTKEKLQQDIENESSHTSGTATPLSTVPSHNPFAFESNSIMPPSATNIHTGMVSSPQHHVATNHKHPYTQLKKPQSSEFSNIGVTGFNTQNEIDFTDLFSKPISNFYNNTTNITPDGTAPLIGPSDSANIGTSSLFGLFQGTHSINNTLAPIPNLATYKSPIVAPKTAHDSNITPFTFSNDAFTPLPLHLDKVASEPLPEFFDMNEIYGTKTCNNNPSGANPLLTHHTQLNFDYRIPYTNSSPTQNAVCEINNSYMCEVDNTGCGQNNGAQVKNENSQDYVSEVLNPDFGDMTLSQNTGIKEEIGNFMPSSMHEKSQNYVIPSQSRPQDACGMHNCNKNDHSQMPWDAGTDFL